MTIYARPETTFEASMNGPTGLVGLVGVQIINPPAGTIVMARTTAGITELPAGSGIYHATLSAPAGLDTYMVFWDSGPPDFLPADEDLVVSGFAFPTSTFATVADVRLRCNTTAEDDQIEYLLDAATAQILAAVDKDLDWLADVDETITTVLRFVCADMVCRSLSFAPGVQSTSETLGAYSYSERSGGGEVGLGLSRLEVLQLRRAVYGTLTGSARLESALDDFQPIVSP